MDPACSLFCITCRPQPATQHPYMGNQSVGRNQQPGWGDLGCGVLGVTGVEGVDGVIGPNLERSSSRCVPSDWTKLLSLVSASHRAASHNNNNALSVPYINTVQSDMKTLQDSYADCIPFVVLEILSI